MAARLPGSASARQRCFEAPCFREVSTWGCMSGEQEPGHAGPVRVTLPLCLVSEPPWNQNFIQSREVLAKGHPLPRSSGSITPLTPGQARTQIAHVLSPRLDPARVSWLIKFKLREVKLCA